MAAGSIGNLKLVNPIMESGTLEKIGNVDKITVSTFRSVIKEFGEVLGIREDAIKDIEGINGGKRLVNFFKNNEEISSLVSKEQLTIEEVSKLGNAIQKEAELAIKTLKSLGEGLAKQAEAGAKEIRIPGKKAGIIESALTKSRTLSGTENVGATNQEKLLKMAKFGGLKALIVGKKVGNAVVKKMGEGVSHTFHHPIQTTKSVLQFGLIACIAYAGISGGLSHYNNQKVAGNYVALSQQSPAIESQNSNNAFGKDVSVDNVGVSEQISKLSSAMEVSQSKALEAFTSTTVPQLFAMAKDPERKDIVTSVKIASWKQLGAQIETGPAGYDSSAKRGTAKQIESVMKVMYLNLALKMNSGNVDDLEQQKIVYTLDSLEGAINMLHQGKIPDERISARSYDSKGNAIPGKFGLKDGGNGKVIMYGIE